MGRNKKNIYDDAYKLYFAGLSLQQVASQFGVTRQCIYKAFKLRGFTLRGVNFRPYQIYDNKKFTLRNNGYYSLTTNDRCLMHRYVYEKEIGKIPNKFDIHHIDQNKSNNKINNLECICKKEHARIYSTGKNQYTNASNKPI